MRNKKKKRKKPPLSFYTFQLSLVKTNDLVYICGGSKSCAGSILGKRQKILRTRWRFSVKALIKNKKKNLIKKR
jgi:hypothetical protein